MKTFMTISLLAMLSVSDALAADAVARISLPLATPRSRVSALGGPQDRAEFMVWIPDGVKAVRGAICNPFAKMDRVSPHWQAACRTWQFAYVAADFDAVKKDEFGLLAKALEQLAAETDHPELASAPLCFLGMSRGGGMCMYFAELMPDRTIASVPVCLEVGPTSEATRKIPVLTVFGEKDGSQLQRLLEKLPQQRAEQAQWAIAIQWGRKHEFAQANNLSFVFFDDVIRQRIARRGEADAKNLKPDPLEEGWLAGPVTWARNQQDRSAPDAAPYAEFAGDKSQAAWLPTGRCASVWQAFVGYNKQVRIVEPAGLGDGQAFTTHSKDERIVVKAEVAGNHPTAVELWDADVRLDVDSAAPWEFQTQLPPGIHSLIIKAIDGDDARWSCPHTIVVSETSVPSNNLESSH